MKRVDVNYAIDEVEGKLLSHWCTEVGGEVDFYFGTELVSYINKLDSPIKLSIRKAIKKKEFDNHE